MFFETFRAAQARLPAGLIRVGPPAAAAAITAVEKQLGRSLPDQLRSFLLSFDGADLFHGAIVVAGVAPPADPTLVALQEGAAQESDLVFAEAGLGDRFVLDGKGRVFRVRSGSDERVLSGSTFGKWLDATVAREQILYDVEGEFLADAFEPDGEEVTPQTARRQAERALRHDPGSAEAQHDLGTALRRLGRPAQAAQAFAAAAELDPANPWPWFDLGRALLEESPGQGPAAATAFWKAAEHEEGLAAARLLAWAARASSQAGDLAQAEKARREAVARHDGIGDDLRRAVEAAEGDSDTHTLDEARALLTALTGRAAPPPRRRLPVVTGDGPSRLSKPPSGGGKRPPRRGRR
ncbi:MAG TPA: SMI1/KNR4 family protein [Polyangia bacterium]|nr:SMI1/KNR4 family protein [Polyangia bacterium]